MVFSEHITFFHDGRASEVLRDADGDELGLSGAEPVVRVVLAGWADADSDGGAACATMVTFWVRRGAAWLGYSTTNVQASDQFDLETGEFGFGRGAL